MKMAARRNVQPLVSSKTSIDIDGAKQPFSIFCKNIVTNGHSCRQRRSGSGFNERRGRSRSRKNSNVLDEDAEEDAQNGKKRRAISEVPRAPRRAASAAPVLAGRRQRAKSVAEVKKTRSRSRGKTPGSLFFGSRLFNFYSILAKKRNEDSETENDYSSNDEEDSEYSRKMKRYFLQLL